MPVDRLQIWYSLIQADGKPFTNFTLDFVCLPSSAIVHDLRKALKAKHAHDFLKGISADSLRVYKNGTDISGDGIEQGMFVKELGLSALEALSVVVPVSHLLNVHVTPADNKHKLQNLSFCILKSLTFALRSFLNAKLYEGCILSEKDASMPLLQDRIQRLYVRKCYTEVFQALSEKITSGCKRFGLSGAAGIGKSMFFGYILFRLVKDSPWKPKRVIFQKANQFICYDLKNHDVVVLGHLEAEVLVDDQESFYVIDGLYSYPLASSCITLFISSPRSTQFRQYIMQRNVTVYYFPVWTAYELSRCPAVCDSKLFSELPLCCLPKVKKQQVLEK